MTNWDRFSYSIHREDLYLPQDLDFLYVETLWDWALWDIPRGHEAVGGTATKYHPK